MKFEAKIAKSTGDRKKIEVPSKHRKDFLLGDIVEVKKKVKE